MRVIYLASAALMLATGSAFAADMPLKAPVAPLPVVIPYNWTGFYVGINVGYSWGRRDNDGLASEANGLSMRWLGSGRLATIGNPITGGSPGSSPMSTADLMVEAG